MCDLVTGEHWGTLATSYEVFVCFQKGCQTVAIWLTFYHIKYSQFIVCTSCQKQFCLHPISHNCPQSDSRKNVSSCTCLGLLLSVDEGHSPTLSSACGLLNVPVLSVRRPCPAEASVLTLAGRFPTTLTLVFCCANDQTYGLTPMTGPAQSLQLPTKVVTSVIRLARHHFQICLHMAPALHLTIDNHSQTVIG